MTNNEQVPLFDTHCHLDDRRYKEPISNILTRAKEAGVRWMTTIGCIRGPNDVNDALEIALKDPEHIYASMGVHPHDAIHLDSDLLDQIKSTAEHSQVVAIGETGLDYFYEHSPKEAQKEAFRLQIALAKELKKPLVIHTRSAAEDTIQILKEENASEIGGIIHCFSEDAEFAKRSLDLGFVSSFSGIVTFKKKAEAIQEAARKQPLDSLLVETDAPYLAPMPYRGKKNEPAFVAHTAAFIAELRGESLEKICAVTTENAFRVFGLSALNK